MTLKPLKPLSDAEIAELCRIEPVEPRMTREEHLERIRGLSPFLQSLMDPEIVYEALHGETKILVDNWAR